jgi:hypothetical protein
MSRSVITPFSFREVPSASTIGIIPTSRSRIICAARVMGASGVSVSGFPVISSRAFIFFSSNGLAAAGAERSRRRKARSPWRR